MAAPACFGSPDLVLAAENQVGASTVSRSLVDGRRESALESWSFWGFRACGVPMPEPQVNIYDEFGTFVGRADAWWHEYGVAGEADGRAKYVGATTTEEARQAVYDERLREDALRRTGAGVIRWSAGDLGRPGPWARRVLDQLHAHPPSLFRGRALSSSHRIV